METKNLKSSIIELRKSGCTIKQIIEKLGCAKSTVSFHINNEGMGGVLKKENNNFLFGVSKEVIENVSLLRNQGLTYREISKQIGLSCDKVSLICRKLGLIRKKVVHEDVIKAINNEYEVLKSIRKVSKKLKLSRNTVRKHLTKKIAWTKNDSEKVKTKSDYVTDFRKKRKIELILYKGGKCENCGYNKISGALQFHHINPKEKSFTIGGRNYSLENMKKEADKCLLICANCHAEVHSEITEYGKSEIVDKILEKVHIVP